MGKFAKNLTRKYLPMTHKKSHSKRKKTLDQARRKLAGTRSFVINRGETYFESMSQQAKNFEKMSKQNCIPGQTYQRLTASRVYYVFEKPQWYQRSRKVQSRKKSLEAEAIVINQLKERGFMMCSNVQVFHPILFYVSCIPDAICVYKNETFLLEVKTLFRSEIGLINEMDEKFDDQRDLEKWKRQVIFSLTCGNFEKGLLIIFDYEKQKIVNEVWVLKDESFFDLNYDHFLQFYLDWIFYDNSAVRCIPVGIRKVVRNKLISLAKKQINKNSAIFEVDFDKAFRLHFEKELTRMFRSENVLTFENDSKSKHTLDQEKD